MKKKFILLASLAVAMIVAVVACTNISGIESNSAVTAKDSAARVARGQYIVTTTGCDDCHSPKQMGAHGPEIIPELRFSGFQKEGKLPPMDVKTVQNGWMLFAPDLTAAVGPWGISYAANLTSDQTGIGNWKEENFIRAMREGKAKGLVGNRDLLPPMPWFNFRNMTDEDLKSIFAYLKTTKPVNNAVPQPVPPTELK
jgi:mono/diheme cytochrome c family protein